MDECFGGRNDLSTDLDLVESASILSRQVRTVFPDLEKQLSHIPGQVNWVLHLILCLT